MHSPSYCCSESWGQWFHPGGGELLGWVVSVGCPSQGAIWSFVLMASFSSLWDPLEIIFICLLTCLYAFALHWFAAPCYIQICKRHYIVDTISSLFVSPKTILYRSAFLLADCCWVVGCPVPSPVEVISVYPVPAHLSAASCLSTSQGLCYHTRPVFLYATSLL